jgi:uncharacterized protein (DUF433 family)
MALPAFGFGLYDLREAARYTRLHPARVWRWFVPRPSEQHRKPVLASDYEPVDGDHAISFLDLVDVFVFGQLRTHGVRLQTLRKVYHRLQKDLNQKHPFAHSRLATDGREVFLRVADKEGHDELIEVLTRQKVFPQIIQPFLKQLDYDPTSRLARLWRIAEGVVLNPALSLGKPLVERAGVKTEVLADAYAANRRDAERVAWWYNVAVADVLAAVRFEESLAA